MDTWPINSKDELAAAHRQAELAWLRASGAASADVPLEAHPGSLPARLLRIANLVGAKDAAALPELERALAAAAPLEPAAEPRERAHLAAARAWLAHRPLEAAKTYTRVALEYRDDLVALRLAQSCWYFLGRRANVRDVADLALRAWPPAKPGFDVVLAMAAFGAAETNDGERAEELARRSLGVEPRSPFAIHSLAHALAMRKRPAEGGRELRACAAEWRIGGRLDGHIAWHLALFDLEAGDTRAALAAFDRDLERAAALDASGCADATDLLWRLELVGVDVGTRWEALAASWARHLAPGFWGFLDVLAGLALQRGGRRGEACALARDVALAPRVAGVAAPALGTLPVLAALDAFTRAAFADASRGIATALPRLGGSLPQRELLQLTRRTADRRLASEPKLVPAAA
jgi:hypothetical protein